jgi:uncharacterized protein
MTFEKNNQKIAVIGTGISGMLASYLLCRKHDITVFEANDYIGGHTNTLKVKSDGGMIPVDTGFIICNDRNYPNFFKLLARLGVERQKTDMGFSVKCQRTGLEYSGSSLNAMFAQRRNLIRLWFYRLVFNILRFHREAGGLLDRENNDISLIDYLRENHYSEAFIDYYILPMGAAIWSSSIETIEEFPADTFIRFFDNHGLLSLKNRPQWYTIKKGSQEYVKKIIQPFADRIRLNNPVESVRRLEDQVEIKARGCEPERFHKVVIAVHSDQALRMLADPSKEEKRILGAIPYQQNLTILHTDKSVLPTRPRAWASWNYHILDREQNTVAITYNMNILQRLGTDQVYCVTLNLPKAIDRKRIIRTIKYHHPVFTPEGIKVQKQKGKISGRRNTYYCGAYWGYGFHEDGVNSAFEVCSHFGLSL